MRFKKYAKKKAKTPGKISKTKKYRKYSKIIPRGPASPFPLVLYKKLTYSTQIALTQSVGGTPTYYLFRANSLYDPDYTGVGH